MQKNLYNREMREAQRAFAEQLRELVETFYEGDVALFARNAEVEKETVKRWLVADELPPKPRHC